MNDLKNISERKQIQLCRRIHSHIGLQVYGTLGRTRELSSGEQNSTDAVPQLEEDETG